MYLVGKKHKTDSEMWFVPVNNKKAKASTRLFKIKSSNRSTEKHLEVIIKPHIFLG